MKTQWFKRLGWFYLPVSLPGVIILLAALVFCAQVFFAIDYKSHSASDTLYGVFPFFTGAFLLFDWIAGRTSGPAQK
jgi:formate hydrogenlyase subunit 3/multisubunit Na+/H+ antiporter MnhD subunit